MATNKNEEIFLSVIMSVFNEENYIEESVDSILNQTYCNFELIIVDDCSTDETVNKIRQYTDERIRLICNDKNCGLTCNLNKALDVSKGKYIIRMDGDDISIKTRFEEQVNYMEQHLEVVLSGTWIKYIGDNNDIVRYKTRSDELKASLLFNSVIPHPTFIMRKDVLDENNIRYNENLPYAQDYDFIYQISRCGELANIPKILLKYRIHDKQITGEKLVEQIQCADITRRKILSDLGVDLSENEFAYWSCFCLENKHEISALEQNTIERIINEILEKNYRKKVFSQNIVERYLQIRKERYLKEKIDEGVYALQKSKWEEINKYKELSEKHLMMFLIMDRWLDIKQQGKQLADYFVQNGFFTIAIYGMGCVGERLLTEFKDSKVQVKYGIDKKADTIYTELITVTPNDDFEKVDVIVVTSVFYYAEIKEMLELKTNCPIVSLEDILNEM